ncbi:hypothetical protein VPH35_108919 [Triticum aestivum]
MLTTQAFNILKKIPDDTRKKLAARGYIAQSGYVMKYLPVPPNCLYNPEFTDGQSIKSNAISISLLGKILEKIEKIKESASGSPHFESYDTESAELQFSIGQYIQARGTTKGPQGAKRFTTSTDSSPSSTKEWLEKMKTLFISKVSGFSSLSVLTGDPYIGADVVGLPFEVAKRITFEEPVTDINIHRLQEVVDKGLCLTYRDGQATYAINVGSKGSPTLKVGQTISKRIVDGDVVFLNRSPSTHKHSLQALNVYIHHGHTVKINPLLCYPYGADFDGDCVLIFYPQSQSAKIEALELFSVEKQLSSSHSGRLNLPLTNDSLLALKLMSSRTMLSKESANQLAIALPPELTCEGDSTVIDLEKEFVEASFSDLVSNIICVKGPGDALKFLNALQPLFMEFLLLDGFSLTLQDFSVPKLLLEGAQECIKEQSSVLEQSRRCFKSHSVDYNLKNIKEKISNFVVKSSRLGLLFDPKSDPSMSKVVEQLGFVGLQLYREGKLYSRRLVESCFSNFVNRHPPIGDGIQHPPEAYGLVQSSYFHGLNPYEELVHAISTRETIVRSSRGLPEAGTLFKGLMAILRDVVICYDGTVGNIYSNSIMQLKYKEDPSAITPGEPVGALAAAAISNPAYKAVLGASHSNNTSWVLMKEILQTKVSYKNDAKDRKVILFLNDCSCPKKFCKEKAAIAVQGCLKRVTLEDCTTDICIEYQKQVSLKGTSEATPAFVGHIHLEKEHLEQINVSTDDILQKCQEVSGKHGNKKGTLGLLFKNISFSTCDCSFTRKLSDGKASCLQFSFLEYIPMLSDSVEKAVNVLTDSLCSVLLETVIKGDPRIQDAKIMWVGSDATPWVKDTKKVSNGEPAVEIIVEKKEARKNGDAWRIAMDACIPVINLIDTRRSIPHGIREVRELLGISCTFDQVVQCLSRTMNTVAKGILKDHLILVANSMTCTGNLNGFHKGGYNATLRSLKVQAPFTQSTFTPVKCLEKAAEKCHTDSLGCVVSSCSWGKSAALGTGSSFQILWNENQLKSNKEYGDGLYDFLALVRTDQEKDAYTFLDDVDYLVEDNMMDDICLSPEWDGTHGMPTFEDNPEQEITEKSNSWENDTTANASWEQNVIAWNDSGNAQNVDAQDDPLGSVAAKAQNSSAQHMDGKNDSWGCVAAKTCTAEPMDAGDDSWGSVTAKAQTCAAQEDSWGNVSASPSDNAWGAAQISQGHENSDSKQPDSWDGWSSAQTDDSSADNWKTNSSGNNKGWKSEGWDAKENRRDKRDNPGRPPMRPVERPPRPRYELPAEAKKVLREIEPIVTMVRKIFRESCDGVRLPLEDEKFIIEKVLEHHPEKEKKVSGGIDHIMVNKHHIFRQSRCFYVVSSDGTHTDFSYNKCMDNYVRKNYAEHAELICGMHFKKCNRDQPPAVDGGAAPATEAKASQSTNPGEDTLPGPPAGTSASLTMITQEETPAFPAATPDDTLTQQEAGAVDDKWV